jgi:uncharacterized Zn finger protein
MRAIVLLCEQCGHELELRNQADAFDVDCPECGALLRYSWWQDPEQQLLELDFSHTRPGSR